MTGPLDLNSARGRAALGRAPAAGGRALAAVGGGRGGFLALGLLKAQGVELTALHLRVREFPEVGFRPLPPEVSEGVCRRLGVPLEVVDVSERFEAEVIDGVVHAALQCREPEPYRAWTERVLLPTVFAEAARLGCARVVTGHFAQIVQDLARQEFLLQPAVDAALDQSRFIAGVDARTELPKLVTPLGNLAGAMLDRLAREIALPGTAPASRQGGEFATEPWRGSREWMDRRIAVDLRPRGVVRSLRGDLYGEHEGVHRYAFGVRPQLTGGALPDSFVTLGFDAARSSLLAGAPIELVRRRFSLRGLRWLRPVDGLRPRRLELAFDGGARAPVRVTLFEGGRGEVECAEGVSGAFPGRTVVFYEGGEVLGQGRVE